MKVVSKVLESDSLILRVLSEEDIDELQIFQNDLELKKLTMSWPLPVSRTKVCSWLRGLLEANDEVLFGIVKKDLDELVGIIRLMKINWWDRKAELGIYVGDQNYRGHGLGRQALVLVLDWVFHYLGLHRIYFRVLSDNAQAIAAFESVGAQTEGMMREDVYQEGTYKDVAIMGILDSEYVGRSRD